MTIETLIDKALSVVGSLAAAGAVVVSWMNLKKIREVHVQINSRMDQLLKATGLLGEAEGRARGRAEIHNEEKKKDEG